MSDPEMKVLLVSTDTPQRTAFIHTLQQAGYTVLLEPTLAKAAARREQFTLACVELAVWEANKLDAPIVILAPALEDLLYRFDIPLDALPFNVDVVTVRLTLRSAMHRYRTRVEAAHYRQQYELVDDLLYNTVLVSPDGVAILSEDGIVRFANPALERLIKDASVGNLFPITMQLNRMNSISLADSAGQQRVLEAQVTQVSWQGQAARLVALRDVTEAKQVESEMQALYRATSLLLNWNTPAALGTRIIQAIQEQFPHMICGVWLKHVMDDHPPIDLLAASPLYPYATLTDIPPAEIDLWTQQLSAPVYYQPAQVAGNVWRWLIPIENAQHMVGILELRTQRMDGFDLRDQRILLTFVRHAATAIEMMRMQEVMNGYAEVLETRVNERTAELHRAKEHVEAILKNINDIVILVDPDGTIQQANRAFTRTLGYEEDDVVLRPLSQLFEPRDAAPQVDIMLNTVLTTRTDEMLELVINHRDGTTRIVEVAIAPVVLRSGATSQMVCRIRDVTPERQYSIGLQDALDRQRELVELKTRFISMVSHEFRTPLAIMMSSTGLLRDYADRLTVEKRQEHLRKLYLQIQRLTALMDDVLFLSRNDVKGMAFEPSWASLVDICQVIIMDIREALNPPQKIVYRHEGDCTLVFVDETLIRHILQNLVSNAIKYSAPETSISIHVHCHGEYAAFDIQDEGIGIPLESQVHLFEAFHRATNVNTIPGTGLGLVIVKQAVEAHGGAIAFESRENEGTSFHIELPIKPAPPVASTEQPVRSNING